MNLLWWLAVGLIAGWATGKRMRGAGHGAMVDIAAGVVGAVAGGWTMQSLGFAGPGGMVYTILVAAQDAVVLTAMIRLTAGQRTRVSFAHHAKKDDIRRAA
jgi:uncharacterized membrane protein YeaQ/YmgE (transglycosylase-associated protein family)